jgi:deoxyribodipyrimidine photo-lyase
MAEQQKYLLSESLEHQYLVMTPFIAKVKPLLTPGSSKTNYHFSPNGMGRTRISEELFNGESPYKFYNYATDRNSKELHRELLIREFFHQTSQESGTRPEKSWVSDKEQNRNFTIWKNGETGYALIDAGMKQLDSEGWLPNRVRMICASFLTKNLQVYWQKGEKYFASKLVDYNSFSNIGNWLWISSDGRFNNRTTDVMSPDTQLLRFDPNCQYVNSIFGTRYNSARALIAEQKPTFDYHYSKERYLKSLV